MNISQPVATNFLVCERAFQLPDFDDAIESYRQIDDLVPEEPYGAEKNKTK